MSTTPTEADKRAAEEIVCYHVEWDMPEDRDLERAEIAKLIAEAMATEREALRLARESSMNAIANLNELTRIYEKHYGASGTIDFRETIAGLKSALAAIEKVIK